MIVGGEDPDVGLGKYITREMAILSSRANTGWQRIKFFEVGVVTPDGRSGR